jgi:cyclopropane-fatty-acyl-phospholipid synthase
MGMVSSAQGAAVIDWAERGWLPDGAIRWGIRRLLRERLREQASLANGSREAALDRFAAELRNAPIALHTEAANSQHYEVPAEFFQAVLGRRLKYSCCLWPEPCMSLDDAEQRMLELTCQRAGIADGMDVLDLGCGWGSFSLWLAERSPACQILAVSNSTGQREFIEQRAAERGLRNIKVITRDVRDFRTDRVFDRVVSIEMFEHMRNYQALLKRIACWLREDGRLFVHVFCHARHAYLFESEGAGNWMGRHFFTGGLMPSEDLLSRFQSDLRIESQWRVGGEHYAQTARAWLANLDVRREKAESILAVRLGRSEARAQTQRWRMFFLACAELFGYGDGQEWFVGHYLFRPPTASESLRVTDRSSESG